MGAPKYNEYWKKRKKHGRNKIFSNPEQAIEQAQEYIETTAANPIKVNELIKAGNRAGDIIKIDRSRMPTIRGFCLFIGITESTFHNYKTKPEYKDFIDAFTYVSEIFSVELLENGLTGEANAPIVMRMLGLTDKKDLTTDGSPVSISVNVQGKALRDKLNKE